MSISLRNKSQAMIWEEKNKTRKSLSTAYQKQSPFCIALCITIGLKYQRLYLNLQLKKSKMLFLFPEMSSDGESCGRV